MSTEDQTINSVPVAENDGKDVEDPRKVFAGNLAFSATEEDLKELFSAAGTVIDVSLITRGTRSLGYGFVTFSSEAEAKKAAETLNKKEVDGREINVESVKTQYKALGAKKTNKKKAAGPRARRPRNEQGEEGGETAAESVTEAAPATAAAGETKSTKKRNKKAAAKKAVAEAADGAQAAEVEGEPAAATKAKKPAVKRAPKPKAAPTGEPSKTTLFVYNLSWSIDDEKLKAIFSAYKVNTATVIRYKYGNNRSKGFGFVDFETEEDQQKALAHEQGKIHEERDLRMRVALVNDKKEEETKPAEGAATNSAVETPLAA